MYATVYVTVLQELAAWGVGLFWLPFVLFSLLCRCCRRPLGFFRTVCAKMYALRRAQFMCLAFNAVYDVCLLAGIHLASP